MKTYFWFNRNRLTFLRFPTVSTFITAAAVALFATLPAPPAYAEDHQFTIVYQITGVAVSPDGTQLTFTLGGKGYSPLLGDFTVAGTAVTPRPQHNCDDTYADIIITTANGGTIKIHQEDMNCYTQIVGFWWVVPGGTLGASGCGTDRGTGATRSINGRLVVDYAGCLSLQGACSGCP